MVDLDALERLDKAATPGPWEWDMKVTTGEGGVWIPSTSYLGETLIVLSDTYEGHVEDCMLLEALRNAAPALIAELRSARERETTLLDSLATAEAEIVKLRNAVRLLLDASGGIENRMGAFRQVRRDLNMTESEDW